MKQVRNIVFIAGLFMTASIMMGHAQVTIGSLKSPVGGALLDLKEREITSGDTTSSTRGLLFPRVKLTKADELYPMYSSTDTNYQQNKDRLKAEHIGLVVYNLNDKDGFNSGLHFWNGKNWVKPVTELPVAENINSNRLYLTGYYRGMDKRPTGVTSFQIKESSYNANDATGSDGDTPASPRGTGGGDVLCFGGKEFITIPESGAYLFNLTFSGKHRVGSAFYYIILLVNGNYSTTPDRPLPNSTVKTAATIVTKINKPITNADDFVTYTQSASLNATFNKGDIVYFKMMWSKSLTDEAIPNAWELILRENDQPTNKSYVTWWKL